MSQIGIYGADAQFKITNYKFKIGPCRSSRIVGRGFAPALHKIHRILCHCEAPKGPWQSTGGREQKYAALDR